MSHDLWDKAWVSQDHSARKNGRNKNKTPARTTSYLTNIIYKILRWRRSCKDKSRKDGRKNRRTNARTEGWGSFLYSPLPTSYDNSQLSYVQKWQPTKAVDRNSNTVDCHSTFSLLLVLLLGEVAYFATTQHFVKMKKVILILKILIYNRYSNTHHG